MCVTVPKTKLTVMTMVYKPQDMKIDRKANKSWA